jgi:transcriptional regulator with XRE-family HTH domain
VTKVHIANALVRLPKNVSERDDFAQALKVTEGVVSDQDIADGMGYSASTVSRWRQGVSAPHPALRSDILNFLRTRLESKQHEAV